MTMIRLNDSGVVFNKEAHTYHLEGKELSGITSIIQRQLFPNEYDDVPEEMIQAAAAYGSAVHESCELFDREWVNDGTVEVADYIQLTHANQLVHEASEYLVTDTKHYASSIDKVYRINQDTFTLADIKTYGTFTPEKMERAKWQLSIYAYLFTLQNPGAKIERLLVIRLRSKGKDHISEIIEVERIPANICKALLEADLNGETFNTPYSIPADIKAQEMTIRELIQTKQQVDDELKRIKADILLRMEATNAKIWETDSMRITRKLPTQRESFDLGRYKADNPDLDLSDYMKVSNVSGSVLITI